MGLAVTDRTDRAATKRVGRDYEKGRVSVVAEVGRLQQLRASISHHDGKHAGRSWTQVYRVYDGDV